MTWAFDLPLREWAIVYGNGRVMTCMSIGVQRSKDPIQFQATSAGDDWRYIPLGSATATGSVMALSGSPRIIDSPSAMEVVSALEAGDLSLLENRPRSVEQQRIRPSLPPLPPPGIPPPEYERAWTLATDPIEHAVIYDDGGVVTIWAHQVETTPTHYRFHVTLDDGTDVIMGTATRPGSLCQLTGTPALADNATTASIVDAAYHGNVEPARRYHGA